MSVEVVTIYITKEAKEILQSVNIKKPQYIIASELIISGIKSKGGVNV